MGTAREASRGDGGKGDGASASEQGSGHRAQPDHSEHGQDPRSPARRGQQPGARQGGGGPPPGFAAAPSLPGGRPPAGKVTPGGI